MSGTLWHFKGSSHVFRGNFDYSLQVHLYMLQNEVMLCIVKAKCMWLLASTDRMLKWFTKPMASWPSYFVSWVSVRFRLVDNIGIDLCIQCSIWSCRWPRVVKNQSDCEEAGVYHHVTAISAIASTVTVSPTRLGRHLSLLLLVLRRLHLQLVIKQTCEN